MKTATAVRRRRASSKPRDTSMQLLVAFGGSYFIKEDMTLAGRGRKVQLSLRRIKLWSSTRRQPIGSMTSGRGQRIAATLVPPCAPALLLRIHTARMRLCAKADEQPCAEKKR
jgi:hypothetical protein